MSRGDAYIEYRPNTGAREQVIAAILQATQDTFELDIKPAAVQDSPRKTGTNARSIDTDVQQVDAQVLASIYTQSGYGGYLELGTRKMAARAYLYPAVMRFVNAIAGRARALMGETK